MASTKINTALKKVDSPLAKYNSTGQLMCIVCNVVVKSEMVWTAHVNGRQHREQLLAIKKANTAPTAAQSKTSQSMKRKPELGASTETAPSPIKKGIPSDFFDKKPIAIQKSGDKMVKGILKNSSKPKHVSGDNAMEVDETPATTPVANSEGSEVKAAAGDSMAAIPEGFFDDPKLDAKVRHKEYKDPVEEEWSRFQKEINEEVTTSASMQEEDQEEATLERQLEEIEEQMLKWGKVLELEKRKEVCAQKLQALREATGVPNDESSSDEEEDDGDINALFNWRSKGT